MNCKVTYKIRDILTANYYKEIEVRNKKDNKVYKLSKAEIKFIYNPENDKAYLSFGLTEDDIVLKIEEESIRQVILEENSVIVETDDKSYIFSAMEYIIP